MQASLKQQTISGIVWSATQKFGALGISFVSNIILARLLSPDDYGCIGLLAIFIVIAEVFVSGGFASALIQKKKSFTKRLFYSIYMEYFCFINFIFHIIFDSSLCCIVLPNSIIGISFTNTRNNYFYQCIKHNSIKYST